MIKNPTHHSKHMCSKVERKEFDSIKELIHGSAYICLECGRIANEEIHLCIPHMLSQAEKANMDEKDYRIGMHESCRSSIITSDTIAKSNKDRLCGLSNSKNFTAIKDITLNPQFYCLNCGRGADAAEHLCNPLPIKNKDL